MGQKVNENTRFIRLDRIDRDRPGGHHTTCLTKEYGYGNYYGPAGRKWAKKQLAKKLRRETKKAKHQAIKLYYQDMQDDWKEAQYDFDDWYFNDEYEQYPSEDPWEENTICYDDPFYEADWDFDRQYSRGNYDIFEDYDYCHSARADDDYERHIQNFQAKHGQSVQLSIILDKYKYDIIEHDDAKEKINNLFK